MFCVALVCELAFLVLWLLILGHAIHSIITVFVVPDACLVRI